MRAAEIVACDEPPSRSARQAGYQIDSWSRRSGPDLVPPWDFKDPALSDGGDVPLDTLAAAVVVEQLARLAIRPDPTGEARAVAATVTPMIDGLLEHLTPEGRLLDGCFNQPKRYASRSELIWGAAYLLFALYYLRIGRVVECPSIVPARGP